MITGIIASQGGAAEILPLADPLVDIQFAAGTASVDGIEVDIETLLGRPDFLVPGQGLVLADAECELLGDPRDIMVSADWVVVIEWYRPYLSCEPFEINDDTETASTPLIRVQDHTDGFLAFDKYGTFPTETERDLEDDDDVPAPVSRAIAMRRGDDELAMSLDQQDVQIGDPPVTSTITPALTNVWIGGYGSTSPIAVKRWRIFSRDDVGNDQLASLSVAEGYSPPANDSFASRISLELDTELYVCTNECTKETGEPNHGGEPGGASVWYEFTAPASVDYTVVIWNWTLINEPITAVYTGSAVGSLSSVAFDVNDEWEVTFTATMGTSYKIALDGVDGEEGFFSIKVVAPTTGFPDNNTSANEFLILFV